MISKNCDKLYAWLLKNDLTVEEKSKLTTALINKLSALPIDVIIRVDEQNRVLLNGEPLDMEKTILLREAATSALNNKALNLVQQQINFMAINHGVHQAVNNEQVLFSKAALWINQEEIKLLQILSQGTAS
jgi:hypothetical protein